MNHLYVFFDIFNHHLNEKGFHFRKVGKSREKLKKI